MKSSFAVVLLCSCAATTWHHASAPPQRFYVDSAECMTAARQAVPDARVVPPERGASGFQQGFAAGWNQGEAAKAAQDRDRIYEHCLRGRGWYTVTK